MKNQTSKGFFENSPAAAGTVTSQQPFIIGEYKHWAFSVENAFMIYLK